MDQATTAPAAPIVGFEEHPETHGPLLPLVIGAIGVVYGDIGTSPLYAFREALSQAAGDGIDRSEILGVLSLALWALLIIVTIKYVLFLMRADNHGEGGVLSLMAIARRATAGTSLLILILGAAGAALFYGDAIVTPALSVLSAVEGLATVPGLEHAMSLHVTLGLTTALLIALFLAQSRGTARVASLFGPICILWFVTIGGLGLYHIFDAPIIVLALSPTYAVEFLATHGVIGLFALGAVFLTVTGAEALTADMGHFGLKPIRIGWFALVYPALVLNYLGQGAFALSNLAAAERAHRLLGNMDWFFLMAPGPARGPLVILAGLATIIASQAVITGAYSLTQQAIALGLLPRLETRQTSAHHAGQIYMPIVNWMLLAGVLMLVFGFRSSSAMAAAYGIAVTGTMVITTCLAFLVVRRVWHWSLALAVGFIAPLLTIDLIFFGANILRVVEGGWVPLLVAAFAGLCISIWVRGKRVVMERVSAQAVPLATLAPAISARPPHRVDGTAVFLATNADYAPTALLHNLKHNKVLHAANIILQVRVVPRARVPLEHRLKMDPIDDNFCRAVMTYGYMDMPNVPADLADATPLARSPSATSFFIGRNALHASHHVGLSFVQDLVFIFLQRNASDPTAFFRIPPNRVVELGSQIEV